MNTKLLLILADYLETVPPEKFNMGKWHCGTTACAMGHAAQIPEFREAGYALDVIQGLFKPSYTMVVPWFMGLWGFDAISCLFGISKDHAEMLFISWPGDKRTPLQISHNIRAFVKEHTKEVHEHSFVVEVLNEI